MDGGRVITSFVIRNNGPGYWLDQVDRVTGLNAMDNLELKNQIKESIKLANADELRELIETVLDLEEPEIEEGDSTDDFELLNQGWQTHHSAMLDTMYYYILNSERIAQVDFGITFEGTTDD